MESHNMKFILGDPYRGIHKNDLYIRVYIYSTTTIHLV